MPPQPAVWVLTDHFLETPVQMRHGFPNIFLNITTTDHLERGIKTDGVLATTVSGENKTCHNRNRSLPGQGSQAGIGGGWVAEQGDINPFLLLTVLIKKKPDIATGLEGLEGDDDTVEQIQTGEGGSEAQVEGEPAGTPQLDSPA